MGARPQKHSGDGAGGRGVCVDVVVLGFGWPTFRGARRSVQKAIFASIALRRALILRRRPSQPIISRR